MATMNPFDLLVDDDNDDPNQLIAKLPAIAAAPPAKKAPAAVKPAAKLPSKALLPAQAVQEAKNDGQRDGRFGTRGGRGGRGGRGFNRDSADNENSYGNNNGFNGSYRPSEDGEVEKASERRGGYGGPRGGYRGGRRGGYTNGDAADGERFKRVHERHNGTGRGNEVKREGAGRGNWGTVTDEIAVEPEESVVEVEKKGDAEKPAGQEDGVDANKENPEEKVEEKEPEEKEMTLEEYEKVLEEKRKALLALKSEERKVDLDKDFAKMQLLSNKKSEEDIFVKLGSEKDKRKEAADKEEKAKKSLSINEFLKPADGERYYSPGGRGGRGRGRGPRGGYSGGHRLNDVAAPAIGDVGQFPSLGVK
ncbi:RGG repeats nuclear RNA binding protein A-like [Bidens hawaiensis]|uniref:RGG repeats nuclear RNA binding protein A-like n=1 Tax=Bidens hawaiensis TaxID=980011 RepID=UPI004049C1C2